MIGKIDHIGIAVKSLEESVPQYEALLGVKASEVEEVVEQKVKVVMFKAGESSIELLEPTSDDSPIAKFIEKKGGGIHHIAYGVKDVAKALLEAEASGARLIDKVPRNGAHGARIGFIHPKSLAGVLTEFCQRD